MVRGKDHKELDGEEEGKEPSYSMATSVMVTSHLLSKAFLMASMETWKHVEA